MKTEYEEIEDLINEAADSYKPIEEILSEYGFTFEQVLGKANQFRERFFQILKNKEIDTFNISKICYDVVTLLDKDIDNDTIFIYTALLSENGLLFGNISDDEQKIHLWLDQADRIELLTELIKKEPEYQKRFLELKKYKSKNVMTETDREEQVILYQMAVENTFLYKYRHSNIILENIGELVRQVNASEVYCQIKPYIYFTVLSRKHKMMAERKNYIPNIPKIFEYQEYKIYRDNGKNFDTYQSYLELYGQLRESYEDEIDVEFTDYCMTNTSNLTEWFFDNCEPVDYIPMSLNQIIDYLSNTILITPEFDDISDFTDKNPVLEIAYENELENDEYLSEFVNAMQNGEDISKYAERLYEQANIYAHCSDRKRALILAQLYLYDYMEEYNRRLLVDSARKLQYKTVTEK